VAFITPEVSSWAVTKNPPADAIRRKIFEMTWWQFVVDVFGDSEAVLAEIDNTSTLLCSVCGQPSNDAMNYQTWSRNVGAPEYIYQDTDSFPALGTLSVSVAPEIQSAIVLSEPYLDSNMIKAGNYAMLEDEWVSILSVDVVAKSIVVARGILDTIPVFHPAGAFMWFHQGLFGLDATERVAGEQVELKMLPATGLGRLPIGSASSNTKTLTGRMMRPYPPGNVKICGSRWPSSIGATQELLITWSHRNRIIQTVTHNKQDEGDIGPEAGTTYTLRIYGETGSLLRTVAGISATTYTYLTATELADGGTIPATNKIALEIGNTGVECYVEKERWDNDSISAQLWANIPVISSTVPTVLNLYYDPTHADNTPESTPYWSQTVLAMPMDGQENSTNFVDLKGKTVTAYGNTKIVGNRAYFDGSGDYLTIPDSADFNLPADFTIRFKVLLAGYSASYIGLYGACCVATWVASGGSDRGWQVRINGTSNSFTTVNIYTGQTDINFLKTFALNTEYDVEVVRVSGVITCRVDGLAIGSIANSDLFTPVTDVQRTLHIGSLNNLEYIFYLNGYIDDLRIIKGASLHTTNFTPSTRSPFGYVGNIGSHHGRRVWDNGYAAVYHLSQDPSGTVLDSTTYSRNLTSYGSMISAQLVDGPTGRAVHFDGVNDYMQSAASNFSDLQTAYTLEAVGKFDLTRDSAELVRIGVTPNAGNISVLRKDSTNYLFNGVYNDGLQSSIQISGTVYGTYGNVFASGSTKAFGNGVIDPTTNAVTVENLSSQYITISYDWHPAFDANDIRSVRISSVARSAEWINASYLSDFDLLVKYEVGDNTSGLSGWDWNKKIKITIPPQPVELINFPLLINLTSSSGTTDFDNSAVVSGLENGGLNSSLRIELESVRDSLTSLNKWDLTVGRS